MNRDQIQVGKRYLTDRPELGPMTCAFIGKHLDVFIGTGENGTERLCSCDSIIGEWLDQPVPATPPEPCWEAWCAWKHSPNFSAELETAFRAGWERGIRKMRQMAVDLLP